MMTNLLKLSTLEQTNIVKILPNDTLPNVVLKQTLAHASNIIGLVPPSISFYGFCTRMRAYIHAFKHEFCDVPHNP